jgi:hypothetical protein
MEEQVLLQDVHKSARALAQAVQPPGGESQQPQHQPTLSIHQLRRPLRTLDKSLARLQILWDFPRQATLEAVVHPHSLSVGSVGGGVSEAQSSSFSTNSVHVLSQNHQDEDQTLLRMGLEQQEHRIHDLWTILVHLPVWPQEQVCRSILRRTVALWQGRPAAVSTAARSLMLESLLQRLVTSPNTNKCLTCPFGQAWLEVVHFLHKGAPGDESTHTTEDVVPAPLAWQFLQLSLPTLGDELERRVHDVADLSHRPGQSHSDSLTAPLYVVTLLLGHVVQQSLTRPAKTFLQDWLAALGEGGTVEVSHFASQLIALATLLVDYAQDGLDQACHEAAADDLIWQTAMDTVWQSRTLLENLKDWNMPELNGTTLRRELWQSMAQSTLEPGTSVYRHVFLPTMVQLTVDVLLEEATPDQETTTAPLGAVDADTLWGVWMRHLVPFPVVWVHATPLWEFLEQAVATQKAARRCVQLVLWMTSSSILDSVDDAAAVHMCRRLERLLVVSSATDQQKPDEGTRVVDAYFQAHYHPV